MVPTKKQPTKGKYPSIRLFENSFLEAFTHVHPIVPLAVWAPIIVFLLYRWMPVAKPGWAVLGFLLGLFGWTLFEYVMHRYTFHYEPKTNWGRSIIYLFHGNHHDDPNDPTRLVMPPTVSLVCGGIFFVICRLTMRAPFAAILFCGAMIGYLCYDYIHYATHHFTPRTALGRYLRRNHMSHHFRDPEAKWGVSSPLWDMVFGTFESRDGAASRNNPEVRSTASAGQHDFGHGHSD